MRTAINLLFAGIIALSASNLYAQKNQQKYSWDNLPTAALPTFKTDTVNITQYGAKPNGQTLNTKYINDAILACSRKGGGVVFVPAGLWLTGPIVLQNNVNLHVSRSAILFFTDDFNQFPLVKGNYEGKPQMRNQSPVSGTNLSNIAITGQGVIDGNGDVWRMVKKDALTEPEWKAKLASGGLLSDDGRTWYPSEKTKKAHAMKEPGLITSDKTNIFYNEVKDFLRPTLVNLTHCKKVLIEGVTFQNSPAWGLHLLMSEDLTLKNVTVKNPDYAQNGDGLDLESCKNVLIDGCTFDVGDDGICIKSGKDEEGRKRGMPTENVVIKNSFVYKGHGGFVIGSEMSGGARNIFISDCSFMGTDKGLRFKTARGRGGVVENIYIRNIFMKDIVDEAIYFDMYYYTKPPAKGEKVVAPKVSVETPRFQNFYISNVVCNGAKKGIFVRGLPEMSIKNISITDVHLKSQKAIEIIEAENIDLKNITAISTETKPVVYVENSRNIKLDGLLYSTNSDLLLLVNGERTSEVKLSNTDIKVAKQRVKSENGAKTSAVTFK
ncbi:glycoside hydrolase family 28 protein [Pedobacter xixiisoli]|uniref:Polygalacturonase n=1 Tax=Pedobacter xixiisoli TaxID=1476464 RepID=A0A285ZRA9_9SPHI|nr:glycoside hydrolase family 28 protein [Pedobacter xixiisoli]SOD12158.1 Polygalacturonase [Pedobacter xixiisoli]